MGFSGWADELLMPAQQQALNVQPLQTPNKPYKTHILLFN